VIVTLTLNPSLDHTVEVASLLRGTVIRASGSRIEPGGKGVNVARALVANGVKARAVLPLGGAVGHHLGELLAAEGVAMTAVPVQQTTRCNVSISEPGGTVTKVNEAGSALTVEEFGQLADAVDATAQPGDWVVASGSLPPGAPDDVYARLVRRLADRGVRTAVDTSGPALLEAVAAGPTIVKPNREELGEAAGREIETLEDAVSAAQFLRRRGAGAVLVSLGPDGAVLVDGDGVTHGECTVVGRRSSVAAGDSLLAGFLAGGADGGAALATALCWAAAAVELPGSGVPSPQDVAARSARITRELDLELALSSSS
jgi:1-phosphofructokinase